MLKFLSTPSARRATLAQTPCAISSFLFLSTPSARRATVTCVVHNKTSYISIHALREEGDCEMLSILYSQRISIHALREEGDPLSPPRLFRRVNFYPRPPRGGRRACICRHASGL